MSHLLKIHLNPNRVYGLDILRALAILFVVIEHGKHLLPKTFSFLHKLIIFDGVSLFFVLSGFLIGGILIKSLETRRVDKNLLLDFWIRRWFRTLPNYFLILSLLVGLSFAFKEEFVFGQKKLYYFFLQNLFAPHPGFFPEAWSLSIEEWFYLLIPILLFTLIIFLRFSPKKSIFAVCLGILFMVTFYRYYKFSMMEIHTVTDWDLQFRKQVSTRLDSLMYGILGAYLQYYYAKIWQQNKRLLLILGLTLFSVLKIAFLTNLIPVTGCYNCVLSFSMTSLATLLILPYLSNLKNGKGKLYKTITSISLISYSMYLLNFSIVQGWIINKIPWNNLMDNKVAMLSVRYFLFWGLTIFLSILVYKYFEIPITKLRDKEWIKRLVSAKKDN